MNTEKRGGIPLGYALHDRHPSFNTERVTAAMETSPMRWRASGYFLVSAVFHYLGPSFAVLLFAHLQPLGVTWLRIASAAVVFAVWRRPWRLWRRATTRQRWLYIALGVVLAGMNSLFYLAIDRVPLATVGAIEFLGVLGVAAAGVRTLRNLLALAIAVGGVALLTQVTLATDPLGLVFAFGNAVGFTLYLLLGHRIANNAPEGATGRWSGVDQLGLAMLIATVVAAPFGIPAVGPVLSDPVLLLWGIGVGVCSSVIPYVTDQLAMAMLGRPTFALMLSILPATATIIGALVLAQLPTPLDLAGIALVMVGILVHREGSESGVRDEGEPPPGRRRPGGT